MNFLEMLAAAAAKSQKTSKVAEQIYALTPEKRADYFMRLEHAHNESVNFNADLDERGQMMKALFDALVAINESAYSRQHLMTNDDECVRRESDLRRKFYSTIDDMWNKLVSYAAYLGYCTNAGIKEERKAINQEFGIVDDEKESNS